MTSVNGGPSIDDFSPENIERVRKLDRGEQLGWIAGAMLSVHAWLDGELELGFSGRVGAIVHDVENDIGATLYGSTVEGEDDSGAEEISFFAAAFKHVAGVHDVNVHIDTPEALREMMQKARAARPMRRRPPGSHRQRRGR